MELKDKIEFQKTRAECILNTFFLIVTGLAYLLISSTDKIIGMFFLIFGLISIDTNVRLARLFKLYVEDTAKE